MVVEYLGEFLEEFAEELNEDVGVINKNILALNEKPSDAECIHNIRRAAQMINSSAAFMEFWDINKIASNLEQLFDNIIRGEGVEVTQEVINVVLDAVECIENLRNEIPCPNKDMVISRITSLRNGK